MHRLHANQPSSTTDLDRQQVRDEPLDVQLLPFLELPQKLARHSAALPTPWWALNCRVQAGPNR